ncbi:hypothetical protein [Bradyrhizobium sp. BR 10289]|uniref:hypothetical protein n=1 Tax=Bradyrhizobium sp. BR 10289 TaxID=2749993 RepID=UPI001C6477EE|nr:hypothetical protein [Bradyrhizobium sp. BR 10289]MBW7968406.1 hypothetical protein [Bradyrhizobium sp. BR 10289]
MPVTVSYDLTNAGTNDRNYIRSMFERFGWKRLGGSVLRYSKPEDEEDWLNEVVPALMIFRSYVQAKGIDIKFFTIDTNSVAHIDWSDSDNLLGDTPNDGDDLALHAPTNNQSSESRCRRAVDVVKALFEAGGED